MSKERPEDLLKIPEVIEITKKWGFIINMDINKMLKTARINDIIVDVVNKIPIREDGRKKIYQTSKYIILKNGA